MDPLIKVKIITPYLTIKEKYTPICILVPLVNSIDHHLEGLVFFDTYVVLRVLLSIPILRCESAAPVFLACHGAVENLNLCYNLNKEIVTWK